MYGVVLTTPVTAEADLGVLFLHVERHSLQGDMSFFLIRVMNWDEGSFSSEHGMLLQGDRAPR